MKASNGACRVCDDTRVERLANGHDDACGWCAKVAETDYRSSLGRPVAAPVRRHVRLRVVA